MFRRSFLGSVAAFFGLGAATASAAPASPCFGEHRPVKQSRFFRFEHGGPLEGPTPFFIDLSEVVQFRCGQSEDGVWRIVMDLKSGKHTTGSGTKERIDQAISLLLGQ